MMHPTKKKLIRAITAELKRVKADVDPTLDARPEVQFQDPQYRKIQYAQNALRTCIEATLNQMVPYDHQVAVELAIRLASYCLSVVPMEDQDLVMAAFMKNFVFAHETRMAKGVRIDTVWEVNGQDRPNFPEGPLEP